jgi:lysophospholipase L1-like esterase
VKRLGLAIAAAMAALCANCSDPVAAPPPAPSKLGDAAPLLPLYQALDALESGSTTGPVAMVQIGDSHTANDAFSGRMRTLAQERFGDAGRGMLPAGIAFRLYNPAQVTVSASGWQVVSSMEAGAAGPFGISALRQSAAGRAEMALHADEPGGIDEIWIEALGQPEGGTIDATPESGPVASLNTDSAHRKPLWLVLPNAHGVTVRARGDGPVDLLSWTALRHHRGVTYSNLGTIGATADLIGRWDPAFVNAELARLHPALILVAFGTNEGFRDTLDVQAYQVAYAARLRLLHDAAPKAAILVMGPPDGSRRAANGAASACPGESRRWAIPPRLPEVRKAQRQVARAAGAYFWDWSEAMGGACSMQEWALTDPPMAAADHVHLLTPGYRATADLLFAEIMRGYARYRDLKHPH